MKILIIDNYDSFTYNIVDALRTLGVSPDVVRNDHVSLDEIERYDGIILSPGPGIPSEAGQMPEVIARYAAVKPMLGICLGHQAIAEAMGAHLINLDKVFHGLKTPVNIIADDPLFAGLPARVDVGRYHSWAVDAGSIPETITVTAVDDNGIVMALRHRTLPLHGVQFHPESIMTETGSQMIKNWLDTL